MSAIDDAVNAAVANLETVDQPVPISIGNVTTAPPTVNWYDGADLVGTGPTPPPEVLPVLVSITPNPLAAWDATFEGAAGAYVMVTGTGLAAVTALLIGPVNWTVNDFAFTQHTDTLIEWFMPAEGVMSMTYTVTATVDLISGEPASNSLDLVVTATPPV